MDQVGYMSTKSTVAIGKMKSGKAAGHSGITVDMMKASVDNSVTTVAKLANCILRDGA